MFDASGSMSGQPFEQCVQHAEAIFPPDTPAIVDTGREVVRTTLKDARTQGGRGAGSKIGLRLLRECALVHDDVHYYTDGFPDTDEKVRLPEGRLSVHVQGNPGAHQMQILSSLLEGARISTI